MLGAITGIWAGGKDGASEFFTSVLYPFVVDETLRVTENSLRSSILWQTGVDPISISVPSLQTGTLVETIAYKTYNDAIADPISIGIPNLQSGALVETIAYKTYNDAIADPLSISIPGLQSGTLVEVISYVNYDPPISSSDVVSIQSPTLLSGTLT